MENLLRVFQKQKEKKNMKTLSFVTQFKIEFLLPFFGCRKVLGNMPIMCQKLKSILSQLTKFHGHAMKSAGFMGLNVLLGGNKFANFHSKFT